MGLGPTPIPQTCHIGSVCVHLQLKRENEPPANVNPKPLKIKIQPLNTLSPKGEHAKFPETRGTYTGHDRTLSSLNAQNPRSEEFGAALAARRSARRRRIRWTTPSETRPER